MAKGNAKQRTKKKQQKQQKRKSKLAHRSAREARALAAPKSPLEGWKPAEEGFTGFASRRKVTFVEAARIAEQAQRMQHPGTEGLWTPSRVAALSDEELLARLAALGIQADRASYLAATEGGASAFKQVGLPWLEALPAGASSADRDLVVLASFDLWRRFRPERPSREMLAERHLDGWDAHDREGGSDEAAIEAWLDFGEMVWRAVPDAREPEDIDRVMNGAPDGEKDFHFLPFLMHLADVVSEVGPSNGPLAMRVAAYLASVPEHLPDIDPRAADAYNQLRATLLLGSGRREEAEAILRDLIERRPEDSAAFVRLAEAIADRDDATTAQIEEAIAVLDRGLATADDADDWDLALLRDELAERLAKRKGDLSVLRPQ